MMEKPKKERRFLKTLGKIGEILLQEILIKVGSNLIKRIGGKKTLPSILFLFLSISLFAQFPNTGNKQRLGFQTTADGLVWRGSISDTASIQPTTNQNAWLIIDTVNLKIYSFDFTSNIWNQLPSGTTIDTTSLSNRINLKLNIIDTASMLTNYLRTGVASNIYLPLAGGTLTGDLVVNDTFKAKDFGNHTFVNYIQNGDFDLTSTIDASAFGYGYPNYIPLHWKSAATSRYVSTWSSTGGYSSPQHFKQYDGDASTGGALYQDVTNWQDLKGKAVTACGWFTKGTLTNSGNHAEIQINDGLTTTTTSIGTTTSWQRACVTKTISANATRVRVIVGCNLGVIGEGGVVSDIDAISLVIGEGKHEFSHKPLFDRDTQRLSGTLLIGYDSENNLAYNPSATSNLKVAGSTSLNGTLGVTGATTLTGGINGNIKTNGVSGATATPEYIWLGNTYSNGNTRDKLKIYLFNSDTEQYGFSIGGAGDIQYHSNLLHDFYIANSKKFSISNSNTTFDNALTVNNATVLNEGSGDFDTRIESVGNANMVFVDASTNRVGIGTGTPSKTLDVNGEVKIATVTATPTSLLGKDGSNVVGEVTTVAQTGLMTRGSTTATTGTPSAVFTVTHGLGFNPTSVIVTGTGASGAEKLIYEVYAKNSTTFSVQVWTYLGTEAASTSVTIYWLAIK